MSFKDVVRTRVREQMLKAPIYKSEWKVLILDDMTKKIVSSLFKLSEMLDCNISVVQSLNITRQPMPKMDAIYFMEPSDQSIDHLIRDWDPAVPRPSRQYQFAHLFFTRPLTDAQFERLSESGVPKRTKTMEEFHLEFVVVEPLVFSLQIEEKVPLQMLVDDAPDRAELLQVCSEKLVSICATFGGTPSIYYDSKGKAAPHIARGLQSLLEGNEKLGSPAKAALLILDRGFDPTAPFLHPFWYQAMAYEMLRNGGDRAQIVGNVLKCTGDDEDGKAINEQIVLNDDDPLWPTLRHMHMRTASAWLLDEFNHFMETNKAAKLSQKSVKTLTEMGNVLRDVPRYQAMLSKYTAHMRLTRECELQYTGRSLYQVAVLEQIIVTRENDKGEEVLLEPSDLEGVLTDLSISDEDKERLIALYMVCYRASEQDVAELFDMADLKSKDVALALQRTGFTGAETLLKVRDLSEMVASARKMAKDSIPFELSRAIPLLASLLEEAVAGRLPKKRYPALIDGPATLAGVGGGSKDAASGSAAPKGKSLKSAKSKKDTVVADAPKNAFSFSDEPPLIVFVAGGITYSEIREVYLAAAAHNRQIIVGADYIIDSEQFVDHLYALT